MLRPALNIWRQAAWQWWWWWLQMPCKLTLWPVELFLPTLTNKTQQKLDTENAQAAKGGKCGRRPQSRRVKGRKQKKFWALGGAVVNM